MDPKTSVAAAANLFGLSALAALQPSVAAHFPHSPALEFTGAPISADAEAKLIDYRSEKVAGFEIDGDTLICLPQAYDLFLKNLVGGLHTVYTKLKRLDITPRVCNVEQVRALRSLGAIQPGVNRCKLISCKDFDALYSDCTSASSRPGRPPKRSPPFSGGGMDYLSTLKKSRFTTEQADSLKAAASTMVASSRNPIFSSQMNAQQLFPLLNPFTAQQLMMSQMISSANQATCAKPAEDRDLQPSPNDSTGRCTSNEFGSGYSGTNLRCAGNSSQSDADGNDPLNLVKCPTLNGENGNNHDSEDKALENFDSGSESPNLQQNTSSNPSEPFLWSAVMRNSLGFPLRTDFFRNTQSKNNESDSSVEGLLLNILGLIEIAATTAKRQETQMIKEKRELAKLLEEEKSERIKIEQMLKEEQRLKKIYQKRWRQTKRSKAEIQSQLLTLLEKQQQQDTLSQQQSLQAKNAESAVVWNVNT